MLYRGFKTAKCMALIGVASVFLLTGCATVRNAQPDDPAFAPVLPNYNGLGESSGGAIYQPNQRVSYFVDRKARHVGDILTVNLVEKTAATKNAKTEIDKDASHSFANPVLPSPFTNVADLGASVEGSSSTKGDAESDQSNSLSGNITVTVTDVLPNGVLRVRGEKWMTLNTGDEYIRISGMVRYEDISPENVVASTKLADARITYSGTGSFANSNEPGWLSKFFLGQLWPF